VNAQTEIDISENSSIMNSLLFVPSPIQQSDLESIVRVLRHDDPFCTHLPLDIFDKYDCDNYLDLNEFYGTETTVLLDRNVFSYIISLVRTENPTRYEVITEAHRLAAAIMAFLQHCNILIEPNIALYEYTSTSNPQGSIEELALFRRADNLSPLYYVEIALGRRDNKITKEELSRVSVYRSREHDFRDKLKWESFNYTLVLKLALLELRNIPQKEKMFHFLRWMHNDFFMGAPATIFASLYLSSRRIGKMIKNIRSADKTRALSGIRNAAWDLTMLTSWMKRVESTHGTNELFLLCTRDQAMKRIAKKLFAIEEGEAIVNEMLQDLFAEHWGHQDGTEITQFYSGLAEDRASLERRSKKNLPPTYWESLRTEMEEAFLSHTEFSEKTK
jgi:hypothetical protein